MTAFARWGALAACACLTHAVWFVPASRAAGTAAEPPSSPLSFLSGFEMAGGCAGLRYEQTAPDSSGTFSQWGWQTDLGIRVRLKEDRVALLASYGKTGVGEDTEEIVHHGGILTSALDPDYARYGLALAYRTERPSGARAEIQAGYRWLRVGIVRTDFRYGDGTPVPGQLRPVTEHHRAGGPAAGLALRRPLGGWRLADRPLFLQLAGEGALLTSAEVVNSQGAVFDTQGLCWSARAGITMVGRRAGPARGRGEPARGGWSLGLLGDYSLVRLDGAGPTTTPQGDLVLGEGRFRTMSLSLHWEYDFQLGGSP